MGPSPAKPGAEQLPNISESGVYYGVYLPADVQKSAEDIEGSVVFTDKSEALKLVKKYKKARFKGFRTAPDAMQFALLGPESLPAITVTSPLDGEKPSPFRGPKPQDMVRFRKAIAAGDLDFVKKTVWENPRYLVSSGDTPAILQEGSRYNSLHIAAKSGDAAICAFVLQTVSSRPFMHHFYGDTVDVDQRCTVMVDLYLNTPDKASNETPLHFACKYGAASVVQVLVSYPQCDKSATNKFHQTPKDVICSRKLREESGLKEEIAAMLEEQFYVPVLRSPDHSVQPVVGRPFSPCSPLEEQETNGNRDITSPRREVKAFAGPMPRQTAEMFRRRWKTPPRTPGSSITPRRLTLTDQEKGWEKVGRDLAQEWKVPWKEYWPFLDTYIDLTSPEGLQMLEDYLRKCFKNTSPSDNKSFSCPTVHVTSPESPISELCSALRSCTLSSGRGGSGEPRQPRHLHRRHNGVTNYASDAISFLPESSPHLYMEKSCQVFAKRIVDCLTMNEGDLAFLWEEARHLNTLVSSCLQDNRFDHLDFSRIHSRLGNAVVKKIDPSDLRTLTAPLFNLLDKKTEDCYSSEEDDSVMEEFRYRKRCHTNRQTYRTTVLCLARAILSAVEKVSQSTETNNVFNQPSLTSEQGCANEWAQTEPCSCIIRQQLSRKLTFKSNHYDALNASMDSSGEESDTSDTSDSEYFTPPSSPGIRSDDDQAMESPDEGPDVYINGTTPSKLDVAVLEALENLELNRLKFPNICRWRHLVLLHSEQERLSWMSSPKPKSSYGTPTSHHKSSPLLRSPQGTPPTWHRTPSLNYN